jgi:hypothetical protein
MISVKKGIRAEEVRQQSQHVLFVEGRDANSVDPKVLNALFENGIRIEPLGPSYSVKSVAEALYPHHPTYYFLIDRDHHPDEFVDHCWGNFPNPASHNLLVWRRREIENYFLDIDYLFQSKYCQVSLEELKKQIVRSASERLFLDVANQVVTSIREEFKLKWIENFKNPAEFADKNSALQKLKHESAFSNHHAKVGSAISEGDIERRFVDYLSKMTGDNTSLTFGSGCWLHMTHGKKVLAQVINSNCFRVQAADGTLLNSKEKLSEVVRELLQKDIDNQPTDFQQLKQLIKTRTTY